MSMHLKSEENDTVDTIRVQYSEQMFVNTESYQLVLRELATVRQRNTKLFQDNTLMQESLRQCVGVFNAYADKHELKGKSEKAALNRELASKIETLLKSIEEV